MNQSHKPEPQAQNENSVTPKCSCRYKKTIQRHEWTEEEWMDEQNHTENHPRDIGEFCGNLGFENRKHVIVLENASVFDAETENLVRK